MESNVPPFADYAAAARDMRRVNHDSLLAALDGIRLDAAEQHFVALVAELHSTTVGAALQLLERCRTGAGCYTTRLTLCADSIERAYTDTGNLAPGWQILDARDEISWHDITGVAECEDKTCEVSDEPGGPCVVIVSAAWGDGFAHLRHDALLQVRIPAGDL
ncbi:hypothetical protein [Dactylosporangium salmoneum]|uniref:Histidine kinase n=1 Tax=Dactylosporangium salmoneum TaxID=53361 RepID=A0ABN3FCZ4_9ACTN